MFPYVLRCSLFVPLCSRVVSCVQLLFRYVPLCSAMVNLVRPENVHVSREKTSDSSIEGKVENVIFLGNHVDCRVNWGEYEWKVIAHPRDRLKEGEKIFLRFDSDHTLAVQQ